MCEEAGLKDIILYVGGNIVVGKQEAAEVIKRFQEMGFNRAYPPGTKPSEAIKDLIERIYTFLNRFIEIEKLSDSYPIYEGEYPQKLVRIEIRNPKM